MSIIVVIAVGSFVSALIVILTVQYQMSGKYAIEKEASIESLSISLADEMDTGNYDQVERTIESALVYENIASISVFDNTGKLVISKSEPDIKTEELDISKHALSVGGRIVGSIEIGFSNKYISDLVQRTVIALIIVLAGFLFLGTIGLRLS